MSSSVIDPDVQYTHFCSFLKWDLGEFDQKEGKETRWGSKQELIDAIALAKAHGIDVLIDAVLNVSSWSRVIPTRRSISFSINLERIEERSSKLSP